MTTKKKDDFTLARELVRKVRRGDADLERRAIVWAAERQQLISDAPPVARAAAEAMLKLPSTEDHVLEQQPSDPDFGETDD